MSATNEQRRSIKNQKNNGKGAERERNPRERGGAQNVRRNNSIVHSNEIECTKSQIKNLLRVSYPKKKKKKEKERKSFAASEGEQQEGGERE